VLLVVCCMLKVSMLILACCMQGIGLHLHVQLHVLVLILVLLWHVLRIFLRRWSCSC
jgi:hypothetical protein